MQTSRVNQSLINMISSCHNKANPLSYRHRSVHHISSKQCPRPSVVMRAQQGSDSESDDWESWADAPDTPLLDSARERSLNRDGDSWKDDIATLAQSLRGEMSVEEEAIYAEDDNDTRERCYLVGASLKSLQRPNRIGYSIVDSLAELGRLADTAGLDVVGHTIQLLDEKNPRTYVGAGKLAEITAEVERTGAETIIFDDELSPGQLRNLDKAFGGSVRLCDRTALILDIFSQRAATREGQLQVELAQVEYQLPRLTKMWNHLERQSGGRVKGMGEKQIEIDRRLLRDRASKLRKDIEEVRTHRRGYRARRQQAPIPVVALVGYTNAGKSTLLNTLTNAGVLAEDQLFATLDPTTRRRELPGGGEVLFSDTVGFIQKLPTQLVAAFRATLEEIREATLLLHVVDVSHPNAAAQVDAVNMVLKDLGAHVLPTFTVWNKVDLCADPHAVRAVALQRENTTCVSGLTGEGLDELLQCVAEKLKDAMVKIHCLVPYAQGDLVEEVHRCGVVDSAEYTEIGTEIIAHVPSSLAGKLESLGIVSAVADKDEQQPRKRRLLEIQPSHLQLQQNGELLSSEEEIELLNYFSSLDEEELPTSGASVNE